MIDIDAMERRMTRRDDEPLLPPTPEEVLEMIAEIRRLGGERKEHRKCPCGGKPEVAVSFSGKYSIDCHVCGCCTILCSTKSQAWAAWDGVE
ncbi:MAG: hypothetical protein WC343_09030 [Bacilli bacterium]|jgi:MinD superfamily P-loop ATPase